MASGGAQDWSDIVGYADSEGGNSGGQRRPNACRYRDYVIRAFNANKSCDRFLTEQIAGNELFNYRTATPLSPAHIELLAATGFWRTAPDATYSTEQKAVIANEKWAKFTFGPLLSHGGMRGADWWTTHVQKTGFSNS